MNENFLKQLAFYPMLFSDFSRHFSNSLAQSKKKIFYFEYNVRLTSSDKHNSNSATRTTCKWMAANSFFKIHTIDLLHSTAKKYTIVRAQSWERLVILIPDKEFTIKGTLNTRKGWHLHETYDEQC